MLWHPAEIKALLCICSGGLQSETEERGQREGEIRNAAKPVEVSKVVASIKLL